MPWLSLARRVHTAWLPAGAAAMAARRPACPALITKRTPFRPRFFRLRRNAAERSASSLRPIPHPRTSRALLLRTPVATTGAILIRRTPSQSADPDGNPSMRACGFPPRAGFDQRLSQLRDPGPYVKGRGRRQEAGSLLSAANQYWARIRALGARSAQDIGTDHSYGQGGRTIDRSHFVQLALRWGHAWCRDWLTVHTLGAD